MYIILLSSSSFWKHFFLASEKIYLIDLNWDGNVKREQQFKKILTIKINW